MKVKAYVIPKAAIITFPLLLGLNWMKEMQDNSKDPRSVSRPGGYEQLVKGMRKRHKPAKNKVVLPCTRGNRSQRSDTGLSCRGGDLAGIERDSVVKDSAVSVLDNPSASCQVLHLEMGFRKLIRCGVGHESLVEGHLLRERTGIC